MLLIALTVLLLAWAVVAAAVAAVCVSAARGDRVAMPLPARRPRRFRLIA